MKPPQRSRARLPHRVAVVSGAAAAVLACWAALAGATSVRASALPVSGATAWFDVSISGTFTSSGYSANACHDANGAPIVARRRANTTWTFASTKRGRAQFMYLTPDLGAGMTKLIAIAASGVRTASESPPCAPEYSSDLPVGSGCGTKHANYRFSIYATGARPARIGYAIQRDISHIDLPDDPWNSRSCPGLALPWTKLTVYSAPPTPISLAQIFDKRAGRIVETGKRAGHEADAADGSGSTWTLRYSVTLTRRH
jgi:hypothetical protein